MNCRDLEPVLHPYLDGELLADERVRVEAHLAGCAGCASHADVERHNVSVVKAALRTGSALAPPHLKAAVFAAVDRQLTTQRHRRLLKVSAAAAGVAIAAMASYQQYRSFQRRLFVEDAALRHAKHFPLEIHQPSPEQLEGWFTGKLDYRVAVPQLPNAHASGARLLNVRDRQAAYIRYDAPAPRANRQLGLFVFGDAPGDVDVGALQEPDLGTSHGYNVVSWRDGDVVYQLVTDLDEADVRQLLPPASSLPRVPPPSPQLRPASYQH
jgi:anti-sigma factor RsiW